MHEQEIDQIVARLNSASRVTWNVFSSRRFAVEFTCESVKLCFLYEPRDWMTTLIIYDLKSAMMDKYAFVEVAYTTGHSETMAPRMDTVTSPDERYPAQISWYVERLIEYAPEIVDGDVDAFDSRTGLRALGKDADLWYVEVVNLPVEHPLSKKIFAGDMSWVEDMRRQKLHGKEGVQ